MVASFDNCDAAHTFVAMLQDEARLVVEFDTKAVGLVATITNITGYPTHPDVRFPRSKWRPEFAAAADHVVAREQA